MKIEYKDDYLKMGLTIAYYRRLKGLTQEQLAKLVDTDTSVIGKLEAPNIPYAISLDMLFDVANALDVPAYKLLMFRE